MKKTKPPQISGEILEERNGKGQFVKGHAGMGGRPPRSKERELLLAMRETITPEQWKVATQSMLAEALNGNVKAWEALAKYLVPTPEKRVGVRNRGSGLRVAGATREQVDAEMLERLKALLEAGHN